MVWPHLKILWHGEDNSAGTVKGARMRGRQKKRWEDNIKEWTGMGFGRSVVVPYCSCCPYLYFGSAIRLVTYFVNFR